MMFVSDSERKFNHFTKFTSVFHPTLILGNPQRSTDSLFTFQLHSLFLMARIKHILHNFSINMQSDIIKSLNVGCDSIFQFIDFSPMIFRHQLMLLQRNSEKIARHDNDGPHPTDSKLVRKLN